MTDVGGQSGKPDQLGSEAMAALLPSLARLMPEIGARYWKAYYAARAANWRMAAWQLDEMRKLLHLCGITRPKYTHDLEAWIGDDLAPLMAAVDDRDLARFERHYHEAVDAANEFHRRWKKAWIVWKLPDSPPSDLDLVHSGE